MSTSQKIQLFELGKGSFYNQANCIEEYEYDKGLYYNNYGAGASYLIKLQAALKKETPEKVFSCEFCEMFKEHLRTTASR